MQNVAGGSTWETALGHEEEDPVKNQALFLCLAVLLGCGGPSAEEDDAVSLGTDTQGLGVAPIPSCTPRSSQPAGWPGLIKDWYQIYGSFSNNGANVTVSAVCFFNDGYPPVALEYLGSNYRSDIQVNLLYAATNPNPSCDRTCQGWVYDGSVFLGSFSY